MRGDHRTPRGVTTGGGTTNTTTHVKPKIELLRIWFPRRPILRMVLNHAALHDLTPRASVIPNLHTPLPST